MNKKHLAKWWKEQEELAKDFKVSARDLHNLFDLFFMVDSPAHFPMDFQETLKLNKMDKWFNKFHNRVEEVCLKE